MVDLPAHARVVIIGGGIVGCSSPITWPSSAVTDVVLLERKQLTCGTTWHAAGLVGQLRATQNLTRLAKYTTELFATLEAETGQATGLQQLGSISVAPNDERFEELKRGASMARAFGLEVEVDRPGRDQEPWCRSPTSTTWSAACSCPTTARPTRSTPPRRSPRARAAAAPGSSRTSRSTAHPGRARPGRRRQHRRRRHRAPTPSSTAPACGRASSATRSACRSAARRRALLHRHRADRRHCRRPAGAARPGRLRLLQGGRRQAAGRRVRAGGQALGHGRHPRDRSASTRCPRTSTTSSRSMAAATASHADPGRRRHPTVLQRPRELHARRPLPARRGAGAARPVRRRRLQLDRHPVRRAAPARCWPNGSSTAARRSTCGTSTSAACMPFQTQPHLPPRPHRRDARPALRDALALPAARDRPRRAPLAVPRPAGGARRVLRRDRRLGARQLVRAATASSRPTSTATAARTGSTTPPPNITAVRNGVGLFDQSSFAKFRVEGPTPSAVLNRICANDVDVPVGRIVYTQWLNERGGIEADLTVTRLAETASSSSPPPPPRPATSPGCRTTSPPTTAPSPSTSPPGPPCSA